MMLLTENIILIKKTRTFLPIKFSRKFCTWHYPVFSSINVNNKCTIYVLIGSFKFEKLKIMVGQKTILNRRIQKINYDENYTF